jgi:hypothetical protein
MPVELLIESDTKKLTRKKWLLAVGRAEHVRASSEPVSLTNPQTGETISMSRETGDVDVYFPETDEWLPVFAWRGSSVKFNARPYQELPHLRQVVAALVKSLGARIVDDEGNTVTDV